MNRVEFDELVKWIDSENLTRHGGIAIDALAISTATNEFKHAFTARGQGIHELRSLSKLVVSLCIGIVIGSKRLVVNGRLLGLETRVWPTFRDKVHLVNMLNIDQLEKLTVRDLLTQRTGYSNGELMFSSWLRNRNVGTILDVVFNEPIETEPGTLFVYSNASAFLLSAFFQEISGESLYASAQRDLFAPLGISNHAWMSYGAYSAGATGLYLMIEDVQKLGRLMLQRGVWRDRQVVPEWFIDAMVKKHVDLAESGWREHALSPTGYGFLVWINEDGYYVSGAGGQYLIVNPEREIVVSVLSGQDSSGRLLSYIRETVKFGMRGGRSRGFESARS